ncbi:MAG: helix-turn-helix transcriptional regulator [Alphaproteobacteria bacterium]|nr:helix-turn-helix transcriptional regulator [Alphaproteobacteria bacterium]
MVENMLFLKRLGNRIAKLRKTKGFNQDEFAAVTGKMINTVSNIERGISDPKITTLQSFAQALGVSLGELTGEKCEEKEKLSEQLQKIVSLLKDADVQTLKIVEKLIRALVEK